MVKHDINGNNNEGLTILRHMESILNESCHADELKGLRQSQVSLIIIKSTVSSMQSICC